MGFWKMHARPSSNIQSLGYQPLCENGRSIPALENSKIVEGSLTQPFGVTTMSLLEKT